VRLKSKTASLLPPIEWSEHLLPLKGIVEREDAIPLAHDDVMGIVCEMDERGQRKMAQLLQFPFASRTAWPKTVFIKSVRTMLAAANHDLYCKRRIVLAIAQQIQHRAEQEPGGLPAIGQQLDEYMERLGPWHVYWMCYLHPNREETPEIWNELLRTVRERIERAQWIDRQQNVSAMETATAALEHVRRKEGPPPGHMLQKKIGILEEKLKKELAFRQKLQTDLDGMEKLHRKLERKIQLLEQRLSSESERAGHAEDEIKRLSQTIDMMREKRRMELQQWRSEKDDLHSEINRRDDTIREQNVQLRQYEDEIRQLKDELHAMQKAMRDRSQLLEKLIDALYTDVSRMGQKAASPSADQQIRRQLRRKMKDMLERIEVLESYRELDREPEATKAAFSGERTITDEQTPQTDSAVPDHAVHPAYGVHTAYEFHPISAAHITAPVPANVNAPDSATPAGKNPLNVQPAAQSAAQPAARESIAMYSAPATYAHAAPYAPPSALAASGPHAAYPPTYAAAFPENQHPAQSQPSATAYPAPAVPTAFIPPVAPESGMAPPGPPQANANDPHRHSSSQCDDAENGDDSEGEPDFPAAVFTGTFYRRDHGGYIVLENGETFNIPESVVIDHDLQHEAEVLCRPIGRYNGTVKYDIELLFQGDDQYSPIQQYAGYVELGENSRLYCVDMNDPSHRYPIHRKDVEIQKPEEGMPCTFNVAENGEFARISRLYRDYTPPADLADHVSAPARKPSERAKKAKEHHAKPEPFLTGCTITILGGQRKWFENIVQETGAELIHDTGDNPERIAPSMRRSNALFMLITATSHRATWIGIEIAKECGIPHFVIQGSKSNLRSLLWENRDLIKGARHVS